MARYGTTCLRGPFDGDNFECYERPKDGETILMERKRGKTGAYYVWSECYGQWVFDRLVKKSDVEEIGK